MARRPGGWVRELLEPVLIAAVLALIIRTFAIESFQVIGESMAPTLTTGDRVFVFKPVYRLRPPARGDVVVFVFPRSRDRDFIKRVIALPEETVEIRNGRVFVNGQPLAEPYVALPDQSNRPLQRVPAGHVFVLGDNRRNSDDSRSFGPIPLASVRGRAILRYWPLPRFRIIR